VEVETLSWQEGAQAVGWVCTERAGVKLEESTLSHRGLA
jgi:hypothetical protein